MRVLVLHNRYRAQGGEERTVADLLALLRVRGHEVRLLERSSAELSSTRAARAMLRGGGDPDEVAAAVRELRAEVVHAHNLHPLFGWRALEAAQREGARTILQLHNFRLFCAIGVAYRDGAVCHRCHHRHTLPGLLLRCRGSVPEAAVYAAGLRGQQPRLLEHAERFAVLSEAHGAQLHRLGLPARHTHLLPNFIPAAQVAAESRAAQRSYALVAGRLVQEKGYDTAIDAAAQAGVPLVVAGEGPDEERLRQRAAAAAGSDVSFTGWLAADELARVRRDAAVVLVPSRCEEACPYAVLDALADGVPVLVSDRGGLPEMLATEEREPPLPADEPDAWAQSLSALWQNTGRRRELGEAALSRARGHFGEECHLERLMALYGSA